MPTCCLANCNEIIFYFNLLICPCKSEGGMKQIFNYEWQYSSKQYSFSNSICASYIPFDFPSQHRLKNPAAKSITNQTSLNSKCKKPSNEVLVPHSCTDLLKSNCKYYCDLEIEENNTMSDLENTNALSNSAEISLAIPFSANDCNVENTQPLIVYFRKDWQTITPGVIWKLEVATNCRIYPCESFGEFSAALVQNPKLVILDAELTNGQRIQQYSLFG